MKLVAATPPKETPVAPVKSLPLMVTEVPPPRGPLLGLSPITLGAAGEIWKYSRFALFVTTFPT